MAPYQKLLEEHSSEGTVSDAIYAVLRNCIIDGSLESGSRLRAEKIAGEMGVSRTPVREALQRLESDEFVIARPRKGLVVKGLSETDLVEIFQIREALEGMAARLAARNARRGDIAALETLVDEMELVKDGDVVAKDSVEHGARAGLLSEAREFTPDERAAVRDEMQSIYDVFLERVASGRRLSLDELKRVAEGRIFSGQHARSVGLVDELGGPLESIREVCKRAGLTERDRFVLELHPHRSRLSELFELLDAFPLAP